MCKTNSLVDTTSLKYLFKHIDYSQIKQFKIIKFKIKVSYCLTIVNVLVSRMEQ